MKELLFLSHRMPYPPNKGDKIRSFHLLKALAGEYRVHLGTFVDAEEDWAYREVLDGYCDEQCYRPLHPRRARARSALGLVRNEPLSFAYYRDPALAKWVARLMRERPIETIVVFSSAMAPYALDHSHVRRILDFVDVDSEKWRQYAQKKRGPGGWIYAREGRQLLAAERSLAATFDASVFVSEAEAELFCARAPECRDRVGAVGNGVDSEFFDPNRRYEDPYDGTGSRQMVFTGVMDYAANVDAICWFVREVLPLIRERNADAQLCVVGTRPTRQVLDLAKVPGVRVTGAVADVRPYLAHARLAVAPMRIARGVQNKVLEALSMGTPTVLTPEAATGLRAPDADYAGLAGTPVQLAREALRFLAPGDRAEVAAAARDYVVRHYGWDSQLRDFMTLVAGGDQTHQANRAQSLSPSGDLACARPN